MLLNNIKFEVNITKLKYFLLLPLIFFSINLQSQAEASNWHFGYGAGLTFNLGDGTVTPNNDAQFTMNTNEGCSSISDFNGNLLFYTDGRNVWDRNHNVMPNADYNSNPDNGLLGDPSSTSSGLIVPKPGNPNQYYIFAVDEPHHQNAFAFPNQGPADEFGNPIFDYDSGGSIPGADDGFNNGLTYSLVDLELNSGNGDVVGTEKNIELITYDQSDQGESSYKCSEKITAIEHADGQSYWVLTQFVNKFYAFRVDETGVNPNPIVTTIEPLISFQGYRRNGIGYMKASPNGEKIAVAHRQNGDESGGFSFNTGSVWLYDFDSATGELSNAINAYPNFGPYGVEFSPDSSKLYVTGDSSVIQFDLDAQDLVPFVVYNGFDFIGAIQLGPDGKIYVANSEDYFSLDVINSPNLNADDCDYVPYEIALASNTYASIGLPPFIQSFFLASITAQNFCAGNETTFSVNSNQTFDNIDWDFGDGIGTSNSENPSYVYVNPGEYTISATITAGTETIVFSETIQINQTPTANTVEDLFECDDDNDGVLSFDFAESQNQVLAGQDSTAFSVTYHLSQEDADANTNALAIPYFNTNTTEQIFVRIENNANTSCFDTTSFNLNVFDTPVANTVQTYEVCDDLNDGDDANGQTEVILTDFNNEVLNGQDADLFDITYHLSQEDADTNTNAIVSPYYNNGAPFSYQVFVRIENSLKVECYSTTEFTINIYTTPTANTVEDLFECDDDNDGVLSFDFAESQNQVLAGQDSTAFSVTYHLSQEDADANTNALAIPYFNTNTTEQIFVRIENNANTSCFDTTSFNLNVFDTPVGTTNIEYYQCDYNNPGDYTEVFDLSSLNSEIINGQNVTISHYETFNDAENESNPITGPYTNLSADQSIYYLLISNIYSECRFIGTYTIGVDPLPNVIENVPLVQCDIDGVQDGISIYNLEEAAENIVVGDDPENYSLTFHTSQEDLDANLNAITNPNSYVNLTPLQTIYTRVENINTTCYTTSYFYLETIFNPIPEDAGLIACDNSEMNGNDYDGLGLFTLSDADDYILSMIVANPNNDITSPDQLTVKYYASENDALLELNQLPDQYISEVPNQQTLYIRVERENDCFGINSMLLQVFSVPEFNDIQDEILCTNTPGEAEVDLLDYNEIILGSQNENDIIISYHSSQEDADNGVNSLNSPYTVVDQQTIYVREEIQNNDPDVTGCFITNVNFTLTVESIPEFFQPENPELCDDDYDGIQTFDLSELDQQVIGGQTDLTISYHLSIEDAIENTNLLPIIFTNTIQDNQTIFIRIENNITGCYETGSTNLIVNPKPFINTLQPYEVCDDNVDLDGDSTNNSVEFDLLSQNSAVLGGQDPLLFNVTYYLTEEDALNSSNSLNSQYTNEINPQTIYTRLDNLVNGCFEVAPLTLKVNPLPVVFIDNEYLLCVNTNGTEIIPPLEIDTGLENSAYTFIWSNLNGEIVGTDSSFFPSQGGDYFLEVFDSTLDTQCAAPIETFTVFESSPPIVTAEVTTPAFASIHIIEAIATGSGVYEFSLDQGPWQDSGLFYDISPGEHTVTVRDINGCGESKETLYVIDYPRFFTPNGDGYNDLWNIKGISNQQEAKIYIFDRYGKLLKEIRPSGRGWDGTYNGNLMPTNDYWFTLYYKDPTTGENKQLSAHFTLKT